MCMISKTVAIQRYFSTPEKPVQVKELVELRKADVPEFDSLAVECAQALGEELERG